MKDLQDLIEECVYILNTLHIPAKTNTPVKYNGRIRKKWGYCKKKPDNTFEISIASILGNEDTPKKAIISVLLHEYLHTCPGCFNHGKRWKEYAKQIKKAYNIKISTTSDAESMKIKSHYYIKCRDCKNKVWFAMKPMNREQYCLICGSKKLSCFYKKKDIKEQIWKRK